MPSLYNRVAARLKLFAVWHALPSIFYGCVIKTISSDAESREEQDGGKHLFVGRMMAELQARLVSAPQ